MSTSIKSVSIVGSGRVATHLGLGLKLVGLTIIEIWSRSFKNAQALAHRLDFDSVFDISSLDSVDLVIVAVSDDAISDVLSQIAEGIPVAHTSGNTALQSRPTGSLSGVFYPLQTFNSNSEIDWNTVPMCIEANNDEFQNQLEELASLLSSKVQKISSDQRKIIHLSAVWACNFSNHMAAVSDLLMEENGLESEILKPLLRQTFENILDGNASQKQTGPAVRKDEKTLKRHQELLAQHPELKNLYLAISNHILKFHHGEEL